MVYDVTLVHVQVYWAPPKAPLSSAPPRSTVSCAMKKYSCPILIALKLTILNFKIKIEQSIARLFLFLLKHMQVPDKITSSMIQVASTH